MEPEIISPKVGIFSQDVIEKIKKFKGILQKVTIWTFVGGVILGAFMILLAGSEGGTIVLKFMGTLFILAGMTLVSIVNFKALESGNKGAQILATMGLVMNICWAFLWILTMWGAFDIWDTTTGYRYFSRKYSVLGQITFIATYLSALGVLGSVILMLYEGTKKSVIRPLKITALVCLVYEELYATIMVIIQGTVDVDDRFAALAGFASFVWLITFIIAAILAKQEKNAKKRAEKESASGPQPIPAAQPAVTPIAPAEPRKTDDELRAEIEEQVRREMIEKEVRERLAKVQQEQPQEQTPQDATIDPSEAL